MVTPSETAQDILRALAEWVVSEKGEELYWGLCVSDGADPDHEFWCDEVERLVLERLQTPLPAYSGKWMPPEEDCDE